MKDAAASPTSGETAQSLAEPDASELGPLSSESLREQARTAIRASIVRGDLKPGITYTVSFFTSRFGVSATPVREALGDLANEGFVRAIPKRGFSVAELTDRELDELHQIRQLLEIPSVVELAQAEIPVSMAEVDVHVKELLDAAAQTDIPRMLSEHRRLHLSLIRLTGNRRLVDLVGRLLDQERRYRLPADRSGAAHLADWAERHAQIVQAIRARDPEATRFWMMDHFVTGRDPEHGSSTQSTSIPESLLRS